MLFIIFTKILILFLFAKNFLYVSRKKFKSTYIYLEPDFMGNVYITVNKYFEKKRFFEFPNQK